MNFVLNDSFSEATIEQYINNCSDEMEIEVESEISFFQKITKKTTVIFTKTSDVKAPVFKNTFSHKIHPIEFTTPPPEFIL